MVAMGIEVVVKKTRRKHQSVAQTEQRLDFFMSTVTAIYGNWGHAQTYNKRVESHIVAAAMSNLHHYKSNAELYLCTVC